MMNLISSRLVIIPTPSLNMRKRMGQHCTSINLFVVKRGHIGEKVRNFGWFFGVGIAIILAK